MTVSPMAMVADPPVWVGLGTPQQLHLRVGNFRRAAAERAVVELRVALLELEACA